MNSGVLLYDGGCGFCTRSAHQADRLRLRCEARPMQSVDLPALHVDPERAAKEVPFVDGSGAVFYGHRAIAAALRTGPVWWRLAGWVIDAPGVALLSARVYRWVSEHHGPVSAAG